MIVHEYDIDVDPVRIRFEIISKHVDTKETPLFSSFDNNQEPSIVENNEEIVEASCVEVINDLKEDIEASCVEIVDDFEEVVETSCDDMRCTRQEVLHVANVHASVEDDSILEPTKKHDFVRTTDFVEFVHVSTFVEFNPTKIRGRIFSKKGRIQQVECSLGNRSKVIFLVSLFNVWVWLGMAMGTGPDVDPYPFSRIWVFKI